jgi:hypothetical protein
MQPSQCSVVALAGRRIDPPLAKPSRFPSANAPTVRRKLKDFFSSENILALVSSAACGTDLIALEEAERLNIRCRIILPFCPREFRNTSVTDRGKEWGPVFDRLIGTADRQGDLVVLRYPAESDEKVYAATNKIIIHEAKALAKQLPGGPHRLVAVIAWEGAAKSGIDNTDEFRRLARATGFDKEHIIKTR